MRKRMAERRERNRSLCTLYTPPPYPGYAAKNVYCHPHGGVMNGTQLQQVSRGRSG